jgi:hypothetical protein
MFLKIKNEYHTGIIDLSGSEIEIVHMDGRDPYHVRATVGTTMWILYAGSYENCEEVLEQIHMKLVGKGLAFSLSTKHLEAKEGT